LLPQQRPFSFCLANITAAIMPIHAMPLLRWCRSSVNVRRSLA
jgi:hypothetical protein